MNLAKKFSHFLSPRLGVSAFNSQSGIQNERRDAEAQRENQNENRAMTDTVGAHFCRAQ
jgi:hypothetical protein